MALSLLLLQARPCRRHQVRRRPVCAAALLHAAAPAPAPVPVCALVHRFRDYREAVRHLGLLSSVPGMCALPHLAWALDVALPTALRQVADAACTTSIDQQNFQYVRSFAHHYTTSDSEEIPGEASACAGAHCAYSLISCTCQEMFSHDSCTKMCENV